MGELGFRHVREEHDPEAYTKTIVSLASDARHFMLRKTAYNLAHRTGVLIGSWQSGISGDYPKKVAEKILKLSDQPQMRRAVEIHGPANRTKPKW
jgi:hypothetical protein